MSVKQRKAYTNYTTYMYVSPGEQAMATPNHVAQGCGGCASRRQAALIHPVMHGDCDKIR